METQEETKQVKIFFQTLTLLVRRRRSTSHLCLGLIYYFQHKPSWQSVKWQSLAMNVPAYSCYTALYGHAAVNKSLWVIKTRQQLFFIWAFNSSLVLLSFSFIFCF